MLKYAPEQIKLAERYLNLKLRFSLSNIWIQFSTI